MATPAYNSSTVATSSGSVLTVAVGFTVPNGLSNSLLVAMVNNPQFGAANAADWNGTSMTAMSDLTSQFFARAFYLQNPAPGTFNANINFPFFTHDIAITLVLITDAGPPDNQAQTSGFTNNVAQTVNTTLNVAQNGSLLLSWMMSDINSHITYTGAQTQILNTTTSSQSWRASSSYKSNSSTGVQAMLADMDSGGSSGGIYEIAAMVIPPPVTDLNLFASDNSTMSDGLISSTVSILTPNIIEDPLVVSDILFPSIGFPVFVSDSTTVNDLPFYYDNTFIVWESVQVALGGDKTTNNMDTISMNDQITIDPPYVPKLWTEEIASTSIWNNLTRSA